MDIVIILMVIEIFPCKKTQTQIDNYITPITHPSIYIFRIFLAHEQAYLSTPSKKSSSPHINLVRMAFKHIDRLNKHNECDYFITQQNKQYAKALALVDTIPIHPSLSFIIREKQIYIDLAKYLHATCFSPVKTTFVKAIKKSLYIMAWSHTASYR